MSNAFGDESHGWQSTFSWNWSRHLLLACLILFASQISLCHAQQSDSVRSPGIAGRFSYFGDYPPKNSTSLPAEGNATITELPGGRLLFYGVSIDSPSLGRPFDLRKRQRTNGLIPPPKG